jgi:hypothetical protein
MPVGPFPFCAPPPRLIYHHAQFERARELGAGRAGPSSTADGYRLYRLPRLAVGSDKAQKRSPASANRAVHGGPVTAGRELPAARRRPSGALVRPQAGGRPLGLQRLPAGGSRRRPVARMAMWARPVRGDRCPAPLLARQAETAGGADPDMRQAAHDGVGAGARGDHCPAAPPTRQGRTSLAVWLGVPPAGWWAAATRPRAGSVIHAAGTLRTNPAGYRWLLGEVE